VGGGALQRRRAVVSISSTSEEVQRILGYAHCPTVSACEVSISSTSEEVQRTQQQVIDFAVDQVFPLVQLPKKFKVRFLIPLLLSIQLFPLVQLPKKFKELFWLHPQLLVKCFH